MRWSWFVLLAACSGSGVKIAEDTGDGLTGTDTDGDTDTNDTEAPTSPFAGAWTGDLTLTGDSPDGTVDFCQGTADVTVADDGALSGTASCSTIRDGDRFDFTLAGTVGADGTVAGGTYTQVQQSQGDSQGGTYEGAFGDGGADLSWTGTFVPPMHDLGAYRAALHLGPE